MSGLRIATLLLVTLASSAWSQSNLASAPNGGDAERARIDAVRQQKMAEFDEEEAACAPKFAVIDCQNKVGMRRRQTLADLKRQEITLDAAQRRKKGVEQVQRAQDKAAESLQRKMEEQAGAEESAEAQRQKTQDEKIHNHQMQANPAGSKAPVAKSASVLDAQTVNNNRADFLAKQKSLEKRRQERDQRLLDHGAGSAPLPVAP